MSTTQQGRSSPRSLLATMSTTKFRHGSWFTPVLVSIWLYVAACLLVQIEPITAQPWLYVGVPAGLAVLIGPFATFVHVQAEPDTTWRTATRAGQYALLVAAAAGGWLLYSILTTPPAAFPASGLWALVCATIVVGPWYGLLRRAKRTLVQQAHEQRVEAVRVEQQRRAMEYQSDWTAILAAAGYPGMTVIDKLGTRSGYRLTMTLNPERNQTYDQLKQAEKSIATAASHRLRHQGVRIGTRAIRVEECPDADTVMIHVRTTDVLTVTMSVPDVGKPLDVADGLEIGLYEDGQPIIMPVVGVHTEVVGMSGSGKSGLARTIFTRLSQCWNAVIWCGASSKLFPLVGPWCDAWWSNPRTADNPDGIGGSIFDWIAGQSPDEVRQMLASAYELIDLRSKIKRVGDNLEPTAENPLVFVALEESMTILVDRTKILCHDGVMRTASELVRLITQLGRSELVHLCRFDQYGLMDSAGAEGNKIRRNTRNRICLKTMSSSDSTAVLGSSAPDTTKLTNNCMYVSLGEEVVRPVLGKAYFSEADPEKARKLGILSVAEIAAAHDEFRFELSPKWTRRLGRRYQDRWTKPRIAELLQYKRGEIDGDEETEGARVAVMTAPEPDTHREENPTVNESQPRPDSENAFGAPPNLADAMRRGMQKKQKPPTKPDSDKPSTGDAGSVDWDTELRKLLGADPVEQAAPSLINRLTGLMLAGEFGTIDDSTFIEQGRAAELLGYPTVAALVREMAAAPINLSVQRAAETKIPSRPRGWWATDVFNAAARIDQEGVDGQE
jgi:hypothetical protein